MPSYKPGSRWRSAVCTTQVVVVRAPADEVELVLACGGRAMVPLDDPTSVDTKGPTGDSSGALLGKRYVADALGVEVLCTQPGSGTLTANDTPLAIKEAKPLPASD